MDRQRPGSIRSPKKPRREAETTQPQEDYYKKQKDLDKEYGQYLCLYCHNAAKSRGMCPAHYSRWYRGERDDVLARPLKMYTGHNNYNIGKLCDCGKPAVTKSKCSICYEEKRREDYLKFQKEMMDIAEEKGWKVYWRGIRKDPVIMIKNGKMLFMYVRGGANMLQDMFNDIRSCGFKAMVCCTENKDVIMEIINEN